MTDEENEKNVLNLSKKCLKKVPKQDDPQNVRVLILDDNELQKIDNIDCYLKIEKLSLSKNQLLRMYGVCRLHHLRELNLSFNGILTIEGLKELVHLTHLNLEGNNIKSIEHLNTNIKLEYLNLSENSIGSISDISFLKCLKELYLHGNRLNHLRQCDKYLPVSLEALTLAKNNITDLNEICTLSNLCNLHSITINENPCVQMTGGTDGFDHRPFVLNWCMSVKSIDGFVVDPLESLRAEWLYSQGRGRQFRVGEQAALARYLSTVCPLLGKALENENERKLRLILSKAQQHQRQLQEEISEHSNNSGGNSPSSARKKPGSRIQSPRFSRLSGRQGSPDSMSNSYHGNTSSTSLISNSSETLTNANNHLLQMTTSLIENIKNDSIMTQSFDGAINSTNNLKSYSNSSQESTPRTVSSNQYNNDQQPNNPMGGPLVAASKMVPVPETLMSPDCCPASVAQRVAVSALNTQNHIISSKINKNKDNRNGSPKIRSPHLRRSNEKSPTLSPRKVNSNLNNPQILKSCLIDNQLKNRSASSSVVQITPPDGSGTISSDDDSDHINVDKLKTIRNKAAQRDQQRKENADNSTVNVNINDSTASSAILIQKIWRGYHTRKKTQGLAEKILKLRTQEYIETEDNTKEKNYISTKKIKSSTKISAIRIQKTWRGYRVRQKSNKDISEYLMKIRTREYVDTKDFKKFLYFYLPRKLTKDMEIAKAQLENEKKIQQLQMHAINALWKKVSAMQVNEEVTKQPGTQETNPVSAQGGTCSSTVSLDNNSALVVSDLAKTCSMLTHQVQQLQGSMRDILNCMTVFCSLPLDAIKNFGKIDEPKDSISTQTDIVAVHTPPVEGVTLFPFKVRRPSSLPLEKGDINPQITSQVITDKEENLIQDKEALVDSGATIEKQDEGKEENCEDDDKLSNDEIVKNTEEEE